MLRGRGKDLVAALALGAALLHGGVLLLRARGVLGAHWTDGRRTLASETGDLVRHAVWDAPETFFELGDARDPALSPDGRWLVFTAGERGLNAELYVAELVDGSPGRAEPLAELNTSSDELAPAFATTPMDGALYFASDRPGGAGGLDLWRASYTDGRFGSAEPVGPGLNSSADDTEPAPLASGALVFASDRLRPRAALDLFEAELAGGLFALEPLAALNTPFEEREPCAGPEDRVLYFASDRPGAGGFDLLRSLRSNEGWLAPVPLRALNGPGAERGPCVSADGFGLLFEERAPDGAAEILRARSRELHLLPAGRASLAEWILLAGLVLLALAALLAKRWHALDIVYKCLLVSVVLHLLLLLYLRTVYPEGARFSQGGDGDHTYRVRIAPEEGGATSGLEARLGEGPSRTPERERFASSTGAAPAPEVAHLAAPERPAEAAPARELPDAAAATPAAAPVALHEREAALERLAGSAPGLALGARSAGERSAEYVQDAPARGDTARPSELVAARPGASTLDAPEAAQGDLDAGAPAPANSARAAPATSVAEIAGPEDRFERQGGGARPLEITAPSQGALPVTAQGTLDRRAAATGATQAELGAAEPAPRNLESVDVGEMVAPGRAPLAAARASDGGESSAELRTPAREAPLHVAEPAAAFDATAGLGGGLDVARSETAPGAGAPQRGQAHAPAGERPIAPAPATATDLAPSGGAAELASGPAPVRPSVPATTAAARTPELDLRAPRAEPREAAMDTPPAPVAFDALQGLAGTGPESPATAAPRAPERPRLGSSAPALAARPESRPIDAPLAEALPDGAETPRARSVGTPYQNRFGAPKLRALEEFGGSEKTERAVALGLSYLASIQAENGAWGERSDAHEKYLDVRVGKTGLALLAFLGAGHVPAGSTEHAAVADRAVRFLLGVQDDSTGHLGRSCSYGHGIATYALAECYALTQEERLRAPLERALAEILRNQRGERDPRRYGGWTYYFGDGHVWNGDEWPRTSITAWQVMALESARIGGLAVPDQAFEAAREFLSNAWDARAGAFRYAHDPQRLNSGYPILPASTPAALFALGLLGVDPTSSELGPARRFVMARLPDGYRYTGDDDFVEHARGNLYFWYYATLALFRVGGGSWERWNEALKATLLPAQEPDGSWAPIDIYAEYAGDDDAERTYTTAMCVLSLEIYYRYFTPLLRVR